MRAEECTTAHTQSPAPVEAVGRPMVLHLCFPSHCSSEGAGGQESGEGSLLRIMLLPDEEVHSLS